MSGQPFSGIVYGSPESGLIHLPLVEVKVRALVVDVSARVTLSQVFVNQDPDRTPRAKYVFPIPAGAAVCAFEMHTEDGGTIRGIAKEREQAHREHEQALNAGKLTSLVEWATDDIFTISVGSVPVKQRVTTHLTYVVDLMSNDIASQIRLQLPMYIGERYGKLPATMEGASQGSSRTRVRIVVAIQTKGAIKAINCPTHPSISISPYQTHRGHSSRHRMIARLRSKEFLQRDFVLVIEAHGLDVPRCFAEYGPTGSGTVALQLTMVPKFESAPMISKEYIFLVDCSGSMGQENRIENAKVALVALLQTLPKHGTVFNILRFGNSTTSLYSSSQTYSENTLQQAKSHIDLIDADYGGTEICLALQTVFRNRSRSIPSEVFVLTDGEVYDDGAVDSVRTAVSQAAPHAPLHVFVLGIGNTASSAMCQGIADAGNGVYLMTTSAEEILGKTSSLVRAGRTSFIKDVTIDWKVPSPSSIDGAVRFVQDDAFVHQAPLKIESIYPGHRFIVFAIIKHDGFIVPREVTVKGKKGDQDVSIRVPVEYAKFSDELPDIPLIHTLAAQRLVRSILSGNIPMTPLIDEKTAVVRLAEQYQLVTPYTSFIAVEGEGGRSNETPAQVRARHNPTTRTIPVHHSSDDSHPPPRELAGWGEYLTEWISFGTSYLETLGPSLWDTVFRSWWSTPSGNPVAVEDRQETDPVGNVSDGYPSDDYSTMSSLLSYSESDWSDEPRRRPAPPLLDPNPRSPSPQLVLVDDEVQQPSRARLAFPNITPSALPINENVFTLIRLQSFDGSFLPSDELSRIVGPTALSLPGGSQIDQKLWATAVAVAYFRKHLGNQQELLDGLVEKAVEFADESGLISTADFEALIERARGVVV
ncbi:hypothetical protein QCA50_016657 [Cerrena zonata]|uniref:Uncharacterized protein n=1 Tax=Cerrena zonata TaxID=2478898 RepID=A0AAW0FSS7_9APHY